MTWPKIFVYYAIAASLIAYVYSVQGDRVAPAPVIDDAIAPLLEGPASRIEHVDLSGEGLRLSMKRVEGRWRLTAPAGLSVTSDLIEALLETLSEIPPIEIVSSIDTDLKRFGLEQPDWVLVTSGSQGRSVIQLGGRSPTGTALYVKTADSGDVYLVGLNALYYVDLISQEVNGQIAASGLRP